MKIKPTKTSDGVVVEVKRKDEYFLKEADVLPFRLKNILVPIDFSDCSKKALRYAVPLAAQHEGSITLVHVLVSPSYTGGEFGPAYSAFEADVRDGATKDLANLATAEVQQTIATQTIVRNGSPDREIVALAKSIPADLIVISTHGRTGLTHALLGSVAEHVVRNAPCPVLVVREQEREFVVD